MSDSTFDQNLLRLIAAQLHFLLGITAAREMFGRSYFALGVAEKSAVDQAVLGTVSGNYQAVTPEFLAGQESRQPVGFGVQAFGPTQGT